MSASEGSTERSIHDQSTRFGELCPYVVSEFLSVTWKQGKARITIATSGLEFVAGDFDTISLIQQFSEGRTVGNVVSGYPGQQRNIVLDRIVYLIDCGILVEANKTEYASAHHWDWKSLSYYRACRSFKGRDLSPEERTWPREPADYIPLLQEHAQRIISLNDLLNARRSGRSWNTSPIFFDCISEFLHLVARDRRESSMPASRAYPSGGGIYSLDFYLVINDRSVENVPTGVYKYLPYAHGLAAIPSTANQVARFLKAAAASADSDLPPVVIIVTSNFKMQSQEYGALSVSLLMKEVGCIFQTMYLCAAALSLSCCALGGGTPTSLLAKLCGTTEIANPIVGEFILGASE